MERRAFLGWVLSTAVAAPFAALYHRPVVAASLTPTLPPWDSPPSTTTLPPWDNLNTTTTTPCCCTGADMFVWDPDLRTWRYMG